MPRGRHEARRRRRKLLLGSIAALGASASIAGLATFGTFTSTTSAALPITSGTFSIALGAAGTAANRLTIGASGLVPGDTMHRAFQLTNTGSTDFSSITLTTTASPSSLLDTDAVNGLQVLVQICTVPWTEAGVAPAYTYTCSGSTSTVLASRAVIGNALALSNLTATGAGHTDNLMATVSLPNTADNTFQGLASTVTFTFTGTQMAGTNK